MKGVLTILLAVGVILPVTAAGEGGAADRARAGEKTREALEAYRHTLAKELEKLETWARTVAPPGGDKLREERALAKEKLQQLGAEAERGWESIRRRMDVVVDELQREHRAGQAGR